MPRATEEAIHRDYFVLAEARRRTGLTYPLVHGDCDPHGRRHLPARRARPRARSPRSTRDTKNAALDAIADALDRAHRRDPRGERARHGGRPRAGLGDALLDRLALDSGADRRRSPAGARAIAALPDPVGEVVEGKRAAQRARRAQAARAVRRRRGRLRGAPERDDRRRLAVPEVRQRGRAARLVVGGALQRRAGGDRRRGRRRRPACPRARSALVAGGGRDELAELATQDGVVDLIIPRGGEGLKAALKAVATVPVIYAASGNCHVYVDASADLDAAEAIILNAKVQRPERLQRGRDAARARATRAPAFLPRALRALRERGRRAARRRAHRALAGGRRASLLDATDEDWDTEFLALVLAVGVVDSRRGGDRAHQRATAPGTPRRS